MSNSNNEDRMVNYRYVKYDGKYLVIYVDKSYFFGKETAVICEVSNKHDAIMVTSALNNFYGWGKD